jgi:hypothetical protein
MRAEPDRRAHSLTGVSFDEAWETRVAGRLDDLEVRYIAKDLLVRNKRALRRPMDLADVSKLQEP